MSKILIVDDSPTDTYLAKKCASVLFAEVRTVFNVEGVLKELREFKPDVVTMDIHMDNFKNGISMVAEIRAEDDEISVVPIIVVSSKSTPADKMIATNAGASAYIVKPITVAALAEAAAKLVPGFAPLVAAEATSQ